MKNTFKKFWFNWDGLLLLIAALVILLLCGGVKTFGQAYSSERYVVHVGWKAGSYNTDTVAIKYAFDRAQAIRPIGGFSVVEFEPGVYNLGTHGIRLRDSVNIYAYSCVFICSDSRGAFYDNSVTINSTLFGFPIVNCDYASSGYLQKPLQLFQDPNSFISQDNIGDYALTLDNWNNYISTNIVGITSINGVVTIGDTGGSITYSCPEIQGSLNIQKSIMYETDDLGLGATGSTFRFRVYAYYDSPIGRIWSSNYIESDTIRTIPHYRICLDPNGEGDCDSWSDTEYVGGVGTLSWDEVDGADGYGVFVSKDGVWNLSSGALAQTVSSDGDNGGAQTPNEFYTAYDVFGSLGEASSPSPSVRIQILPTTVIVADDSKNKVTISADTTIIKGFPTDSTKVKSGQVFMKASDRSLRVKYFVEPVEDYIPINFMKEY